jgi:hypothetical protein
LDLTHWLTGVGTKWAGFAPHTRVLLLAAVTVFLTELALRRFARHSRFYAGWTRAFQAVGHVWTMVILSLIYLVAVGPISLGMRLRGKDLLDRRLGTQSSVWRDHVPNPLGPEAAARHQF